MSQSIYVLEGTKQARKRFIKEGKPQMEFSYTWIPTEVTFDTLQDLEELITILRNNGKGTQCFIRGNPNEKRNPYGRWIRRKDNNSKNEGFYTYDEAKRWVYLDVDTLRVEAGEKPLNPEDLRKRLAREIDFIHEDTEMLVDFSSSAGVEAIGQEQQETKWKAHIYIMLDRPITSEELRKSIDQHYKLFDSQANGVIQPIFFEEPEIDKDYWLCGVKERLHYLEGKEAKREEIRRASVKSLFKRPEKLAPNEKKRKTNEMFLETQKEGQRHKEVHRFFCHIVATGQDGELWKKKYCACKIRDYLGSSFLCSSGNASIPYELQGSLWKGSGGNSNGFG